MRRSLPVLMALVIAGLVLASALARPSQQQPGAYLPIILKPGTPGAIPSATQTPTRTSTSTPSATPTRTATATPTEIPVTLLDNGDFEQDGLHWLDTSNYITNTLPIVAHSGTHALWLRRVSGETSAEVDRDITIPLDRPVLSYWIWIRSTEPTCGDDRGGVSFSAATPFLIDSFDLCTATATSGWVHRTVDLSTVAGQTGTLVLIAGAFDGDLTGSELLFDDIGFRSLP